MTGLADRINVNVTKKKRIIHNVIMCIRLYIINLLHT